MEFFDDVWTRAGSSEHRAMTIYTYKLVPAPRAPRRIKGVRGDEARFAMTLEELINDNAAEGWEFLRADTLPCEHRGWFSRRVNEQTVLVFRRGHLDEPEVVSAARSVRTHAEPRLAADRSSPRRVNLTRVQAEEQRVGRDRSTE